MKKFVLLILCAIIICLSSCQHNKGNEIDTTEKNDHYYDQVEPTNQYNYYILNTKTEKYHLPSCSYLPSEANAKKIEKYKIYAYSSYSPCGHCNP